MTTNTFQKNRLLFKDINSKKSNIISRNMTEHIIFDHSYFKNNIDSKFWACRALI